MMKPLCAVLAAASLMAVAAPAFAGDDDAMKARVSRRVDQVFAKLDADGDGRISKAEAEKGPKMSKAFDRVDADHDGFVSRAEMSAAVERRMARAQQRKQAAPGSQAPGATPAS
ncbi:MAG TPA: EF-hand domain-containing protein [Kofleriaceae bacterium]|nr:EF-hand domain-containing protein [Kofleriaceae bacterium]